jgi:hypothetical protein
LLIGRDQSKARIDEARSDFFAILLGDACAASHVMPSPLDERFHVAEDFFGLRLSQEKARSLGQEVALVGVPPPVPANECEIPVFETDLRRRNKVVGRESRQSRSRAMTA